MNRLEEFLPSFTYPWVLAALFVPFGLMLWVWIGRRSRIVMPFDHGIQPKGSLLRALIDVARMLPAVVLAIVIVILAGPQRLGEPKSKRVLTNIQFCVDVSGSMNGRFGDGTRYDASMSAINEFLDFREGDAFGLTFFGNEVLHWVPLTSDPNAIRCAPPFMNPRNPGHPNWLVGTEIGKALLECRKEMIKREEGDRMVVLVSDGVSSDLNSGSDMQIAKRLFDDRITVYAIHIGGGEAPGTIVNITNHTGGEVFTPGDPGALQRVFRKIDQMQGTRMEKISAEVLEYLQPFALASLIAVALAVLSSFGLRYTPW